jgi:DNA invertase Pin-like site-specific DNA recombinase
LPANRRAATNLGYARVSTVDQQAGFDAQIRELEAAGVERIFEEKVSSIVERPQLEQVLDWLREGDVLTVTRLDRLARSTRQLLEIAERVKSKAPRCAC